MITSNIDLALEQLHKGGIFGMPTETVYGLAADANCESAIKKIYAIKKRPSSHPLIMHVAHDWDLHAWAKNIPPYVFPLIEQFWPGPLTLVLNLKSNSVSPAVTGGQNTIAIRCPRHSVAQDVLMRFGSPLVAPSANLFGKISPTTAEHVEASFKHDNLTILDGGRCQVGIESTILMATDSRGYQILRHGMIDERAINAVISNKRLHEKVDIRTPGNLERHYEPEKPLYFIRDVSELNELHHRIDKKPYILTFSQYQHTKNPWYCKLPVSPQDVAHELYYQLRRADQSPADYIVIELPPNTDGWEAIREKITKSGQKLPLV